MQLPQAMDWRMTPTSVYPPASLFLSGLEKEVWREAVGSEMKGAVAQFLFSTLPLPFHFSLVQGIGSLEADMPTGKGVAAFSMPCQVPEGLL